MKKIVLVISGMVVVLIIIGIVNLTRPSSSAQGEKGCVSDSDCVVFGKTGDCNCGCYNKENLPTSSGGECFCLAPTSCRCIAEICEGVFPK